VPESGYVYALINPSLDGLVKVGMTTRTPEERAKEISASTGVPTPFVVAFYEAFHDCVSAEEYVHAKLESHGYRHSENREFFAVELNIVIKAIIEARCALEEDEISDDDAVAQSTELEGSQVDTVLDDEENLFIPKEEKYLMALQLCYKINELLKDAQNEINEHISEDAASEQRLRVSEFQAKLEEYSKGLESAFRSVEEELLNNWMAVQSELPRLLVPVTTEDHEPELIEDYGQALNELSSAAAIAEDKQ
jgi:hypothetical protein